MHFLFGGVPFGCDNIGDEAILGCAVGIFRRVFPGCSIAVCTREGTKTASLLGVETRPLYGFDAPAETLEREMKDFDAFIWTGATGLSDYPQSACALIEAVKRAGKPFALWGVGMNDEFNPAFFQIRGKRASLCALLRKITGIDWKSHWEAFRTARIRRRIASALAGAKLLMLRDERSLGQLRRCAPFPAAFAGADSAIVQSGVQAEKLNFSAKDQALWEKFPHRLAICVSAQSPVRELEKFAKWLDRFLETTDFLAVFAPMNPKTDDALMRSMLPAMRHADRVLPTAFETPEEVRTLSGACTVVLSSRLHLMILALNALTPCVGIARGSKIASFLERFGLPVAGNTDGIDFARLDEDLRALIANEAAFRERAAGVRTEMLRSLEEAEHKLRQAFEA